MLASYGLIRLAECKDDIVAAFDKCLEIRLREFRRSHEYYLKFTPVHIISPQRFQSYRSYRQQICQ